MTQALEIRTPHADVSALVRELAPRVDDLSIRLPCERPIPTGRWVRFSVLLADGSKVFEGIGRAEGSRPEGTRFHVHLSQLSFDARNEVMYERLLIARDAAEETGTIHLEAVDAELVRGPSRSAAPPPPSRKPSAGPPPIPRTAGSRPAQGGRPPSLPPVKPARPLVKSNMGGLADVARRPGGDERSPARLPSERSGEPEARERGWQLEIPAALVEQARALAPTLPRPLTDPKRAPEEVVLRMALRLGLAALAALGDDEAR